MGTEEILKSERALVKNVQNCDKTENATHGADSSPNVGYFRKFYNDFITLSFQDLALEDKFIAKVILDEKYNS